MKTGQTDNPATALTSFSDVSSKSSSGFSDTVNRGKVNGWKRKKVLMMWLKEEGGIKGDLIARGGYADTIVYLQEAARQKEEGIRHLF